MSAFEQSTLDAVIHLMFAFDLGYEIDLAKAAKLLPGESEPLARRKRTPSSIRYRPEPIRSPIDADSLALPKRFEGLNLRKRGEVAVFDFGAITITYQVSLETTSSELTELAASLADYVPLTSGVRQAVSPLIDRLAPAVEDFEPSNLSEEYFVFQVQGDKSGEWIQERSDWIAGLVRLESGPLSPEEVQEALKLRISYAPSDLVVLDWAAAFVADDECADTLQAIEFANVQLLEFRHIDDRLDDRLEAAFRMIQAVTKRRWYLPARHARGEAVRQVRELEIEAASLFERADNALKLIGDHYLSRVFRIASQRFHLDEWQQSIRRKLDAVGDVFDVLTQQDHSRRTETLEIAVVVLIMVEIVLSLVRK